MVSCDKLGFLSTSQIQKYHGLAGRRNTLRILNEMGGLLNNFHMGELIWYLSARGRKEIGSETVRKRSPLVPHTVMRNSVYCEFKPDVWKPEYSVKWNDNELIADAIFKKNNAYTFLEVDLTQSMAANQRKISAFAQLRDSGKWQAKYGVFPTLMFLTTTESRRQKLRGLLDGFKAEVLTINDIK